MKKIVIVLSLASFLSVQSFAQNQNPDGQAKAGPRKQLATIVFAGLGGAVLGLSTLSFYGRPQDRLNNIAIGFAVGIFVGAIWTTYNAAKVPSKYTSVFPELEFNQRKHEHKPAVAVNFFSYQF